MRPIIEAREICKTYQIGSQSERYLSFRDRLSTPNAWLAQTKTEPFHALTDVSFDIYPGETVGIIGKNGAGKSTLLKILSRITPPSSGNIKLRGRVASLLEVGTGFHSELTGRENIFLNGAILGMKKIEIKQKFDEIVQFSGIEKFLDTPVKKYSSGMQLRLAFSVSAHLDPEILLIDEVLSVGDDAFQRKCLEKMEAVSRTDGRTIIMVSHDLSLISKMSNTSILLNDGQIISKDLTNNVISLYTETLAKGTRYFARLDADSPNPKITSIKVSTSRKNYHVCPEPMAIEVEVSSNVDFTGANISIQICDSQCKPIVYTYLFHDQNSQLINLRKGKNTFECQFASLRLYKGTYTLIAHLSDLSNHKKLETLKYICPFSVVMESSIEFGWNNSLCVYIEDFIWRRLA